MAYATAITVYKNRNHTIRVVVDLTDLVSLTGAILTFSVRTGAVSGQGQRVIVKTNQYPSIAIQAAVVSADTVEFYLDPIDTTGLAIGNYTADAVVQTSAGTFQLLAPLAFTLAESVSP